jgi:hypothetical protein
VALTTAATGRASAEQRRLDEARTRTRDWRQWGPYLSERAWGTVREDYSAAGEAWDAFPHDHARSRVYRWNEDGLAGISDRHQRICFALALWNGRDPILKERLFGLSGQEGNHGEDVKEYYYYVDSTPTHSYMKFLYKYPQEPFPYERLVLENRRRSRQDPEFELADTGIFDQHRYFDVVVEYAKASPDDILIRITATNRGPEASLIHVLPTIWFRNTWSWTDGAPRPGLQADAGADPVRIDLSTAEGDRGISTARAARAALHRERVERGAAVGHVKPHAVREGRHRRVRPDRPGNRHQSGAPRHQSGGALHRDDRSRRLGGVDAAADGRSCPAAARQIGLDAGPTPAGGGRVLRFRDPTRIVGRRPRRDAPVAGRPAVVQAVLPLRCP